MGRAAARADDPELLIVARWPAAGERDATAEAEVGALVDLVRAVRNARAEAHVEAATWLPVRLAVPGRSERRSLRCGRLSSGSRGPGRSRSSTIGRRCPPTAPPARSRSWPATWRRSSS